MRLSLLNLGQSLILEKKTINLLNMNDFENTEELFIDRSTFPEGHKSSKEKRKRNKRRKNDLEYFLGESS